MSDFQCDIGRLLNDIQNHPCRNADQNWDRQKHFNELVINSFTRLLACLSGDENDTFLYRFRLIQDLDLRDFEPYLERGKAQAIMLTRNPTTGEWEDALDPDDEPIVIVVKDPNSDPGMYQGFGGFSGNYDFSFGGDQGYAVRSPGEVDGEDDLPVFLITSMEMIAQDITYTCVEEDEDNAGQFIVSLNDFTNGRNPFDHLDPNAIDADTDPLTEDPLAGFLRVIDWMGVCTLWHDRDCLGQARWNKREKQYEIVNAQFLCKSFQGTLVYPICVGEEETEPAPPPGDEPFQVMVGKWYYQGNHSAVPQQYMNVSEDPEVEEWLWADQTLFEIENYCEHRGNAGAKVVVQGYIHIKDPEDEEDTTRIVWNIEDMEKNLHNFVKGFDWQEGYCELEAIYHRVAVESCNYEYQDDVGIPFTEEELVEDFYHDYYYDPENPGTERCRTMALTGLYCAIRRGDGIEPIVVETYEKQEVMYYWGYGHQEAIVGEQEEARWIYYETNYVWTPCVRYADTVFRNLYRQDIITDFELVDSEDPETCKVIANTQEAWHLNVFFPAAVPVGVDIDPVVEFTARTVVIDVYVDVDELKQDLETVYIACFRDLSPETIIGIEDCPE